MKLTYPLVDENGESFTSTEKIAYKFSQYFTNIGPNLTDKIAPAPKSFQDFINSVPSDSLSSFTHVTARGTQNNNKGFKDGKAPGADKKHQNLFQIRCLQSNNALTAVVPLACLEIRPRNEEAINPA